MQLEHEREHPQRPLGFNVLPELALDTFCLKSSIRITTTAEENILSFEGVHPARALLFV